MRYALRSNAIVADLRIGAVVDRWGQDVSIVTDRSRTV